MTRVEDVETPIGGNELFSQGSKRSKEIPDFGGAGKNGRAYYFMVHERKITISYRPNQAKKNFHALQSIKGGTILMAIYHFFSRTNHAFSNKIAHRFCFVLYYRRRSYVVFYHSLGA
jgi:hypothetical protein